ncbi:MAG: ketopantoate reductase family protein, partial [Chloroflexia bacterium]|nr:ketopantoate reductase family protein [Chloroflexia bacterium]
MAIVIVGGGAIGLQVAGRLALSGSECAVLARPQTVDALLDRPLSITLEGATRRVNVDAATSPDDLLGPYRMPELAIVCVKGYDTPGVIPTLRALKPGRILTLQNGIGNEELLAEAFGQQQIIAGSIT